MTKRFLLAGLGCFVIIGICVTQGFTQNPMKAAIQVSNDGKSSAIDDSFSEDYGEAVAISGSSAFVGEARGSLETGNVTILSRDSVSGEWTKTGKLESDPPEIANRFGITLDADDDRLIVGAPKANSGVGAAYVYRRNPGGDWLLEGTLIGDNPSVGRQFARRSVSISGNLAAVGTGRPGAAHVFEFDTLAGVWAEIGIIESQDTPPEWLGYRVQFSGDRLALSALFANGQEGGVAVVERDSVTGNGVLTAEFTVPGSLWFGRDMVLDGDIIAVGQVAEGGSSFIYEYDHGTKAWEQTYSWDFFAGGFGVSGSSVIAGNPSVGDATVFRKNTDSTWVKEATILGNPGLGFGFDADISGDYAIVGEARSGSSGPGHVYIYERDENGSWSLASDSEGDGTVFPSITGGSVACAAGKAAVFSCDNVDLVSFVNMTDLMAAGGRMADIWGWTDPVDGHEYAIVTHVFGTTFVDVTDAENPVVVGLLPNRDGSHPNPWHDAKVYKDHVFVVADNAGPAGMMVFDLTQLRTAANLPVVFSESAHFDLIDSSHNIAINEATGFAYIGGARSTETTCGGGLYIVDISKPLSPEFVTCYADPSTGRRGMGYTHDAECVIYQGPDTDYQGSEICFGSNETAIQITNVADKTNPATIATATYPRATYVHQGSLSKDQAYFFQDDELDESFEHPRPTTYIWDVSDLDDPVLAATYVGSFDSIDHNMYVKDDYLYQANYGAGLQILDIRSPETPVEVAFFDTAPGVQTTSFGGAWSSYPFFESGNIVVSSEDEGLFVLRADLQTEVAAEETDAIPERFSLSQNYPNPFNPSTRIEYSLPKRADVNLWIIDQLGRTVAQLVSGSVPTGVHTATWNAEGFASGVYHYRIEAGDFIQTKSMFLAK